ncbi:MAG: threonine-phosphate decarboxylase [Salinarimonadaceae bacterium]|nr:MAG: threonine-phosphate decarboxylase [Salinarimonadaceae bacterium]
MRDHGGDLDAAARLYGGAPEEWLDLSTGINRLPYPIPSLAPDIWRALPTAAAIRDLEDAARAAYGAPGPLVALAGAQAAIQLAPRLRSAGLARVLSPTYNEHAAALCACGWRVEAVASAADLAGADLAVIVNPNNPDGRVHAPDALRALAGEVGLLVVDESFADPHPELSVADAASSETGGEIFVLRSFGKFYGLAGIRLGFALGREATLARLRELAGPWAVSGPAIAIGAAALRDARWRATAIARLGEDAQRLDAMAGAAGLAPVGGTALFRLYETPDAARAQERLAQRRIWSRVFPYSRTWLRLGLPGGEEEWARLAAALDGLRG